MLKVGIIGIGNAGNQTAVLGSELLNIPVMVVNSSEKDLSTVPEKIQKVLISDKEGLSKGAGKNRAKAKSYLKDSIMKFISATGTQDFLNTIDVLFIVSSTGGGTGSGTALLMTSILKKTYPDLKVIPVGIAPVNNEALSAHVNTLEYLDELYNTLGASQTYMLYDNGALEDLPSYKMMEEVNKEIIKDIEVISCAFNRTTKYDSIDEEDMRRLISFPGRICVSRVEDIKEKDIDKLPIEEMLISKIKSNCHVEMQRDKKVIASGIITNLSETLSETFDNNMPKVCEFVGVPDHAFNHIHINEERKLPNNVYLILSGLSPVNDKINKISDRIDEINERQRILDEENALNTVDIKSLSTKMTSKEKGDVEEDDEVDLSSIFSDFGI